MLKQALTLLILLLSSHGLQAVEPRQFPTCLGQVCLVPKPPSDREIANLYGDGSSGLSKLGKTYCYRSTQQNGRALYASFRVSDHLNEAVVSSIQVSALALCARPKHTKKKISASTPEGVAIGSSKQKVEKAYGAPTYEYDTSNDGEIHHYNASHPGHGVDAAFKYVSDEKELVALFYFRRNKLISIEISAEE